MLLNIALVAVAVVVAVILLWPAVRHNRMWRATVTPLASIIGSGFLVIVPLLGNVVGTEAIWFMVVIVLLAYAIGGIIRFNIQHAEPALARPSALAWLTRVNYLADFLLGLAYIISVSFYIRLLASFVMRGAGDQNELVARGITTAVLLFIGIVGFWKGLDKLEKLEEYAVSIKLSIIASLLVGLVVFNFKAWSSGVGLTAVPPDSNWWHNIRVLAGTLLVVQGFETSRYLGSEYNASLRIKSMRWAQIISGAIYIVFVALATTLLTDLPAKIDDTAIIDIVRPVAAVLPAMLILAAVMSQFSAAVADTVGGGGLLTESLKKKITLKQSYGLIIALAIVLIWTTNIFGLIAWASRAFALYYLLQTVEALMVASRDLTGSKRRRMQIFTLLLIAVLAFVVIFAVSAG